MRWSAFLGAVLPFLFSLGGMGGDARAEDAQPLTGSLEVDASQVLGPVNRLVFGHNIEAADSAGIFGPTVKDKIYRGDGLWLPNEGKPSEVILGKAREIGISMLRYPGGCLVHNFDWRKAVGPRDKRGDWQFGVDEYLQVCNELNIEPLMMVSDYVLPAEEMPRFAADLVEYLNAPATPDHPWAMKRKEWGHAEPYKVKWFELGNESDHGNHDVVPRRQYTPDGYAKYAVDCMAAMRAVDPTIKIGILSATGAPPESEWNKIVYRTAGKKADFIVAHMYLGGSGVTINDDNERQAYLTGFSTTRAYQNTLDRYREKILLECGRNVPLAITEFNNSLGGDKPKPYRFTLAGGLIAADVIRLLLLPENNIAMANFWQMFNGYFGSIRIDFKTTPDYQTKDLAAFRLFRLWGQHFGADLVKTTVDGPKMEVDGMGGVSPSRGTDFRPPLLIADIPVASEIDLGALDDPKLKGEMTPDGVLKVDFDQITGNHYPCIGHYRKPGEVGPDGADYTLSCEARFVPGPGSADAPIAMGLGDDRGWGKSHSAITITGINGPEWKEISGTLRGLKDAPGVQIVLRFESGAKVISGHLEVRNMKLRAMTKATFPAYDLLTSSASLSKGGDRLYVMVFNKSENKPIATEVRVKGFAAARVLRWEVNGPSLGAIDGVRDTKVGEAAPVDGEAVAMTFPAHSMTALEFEKADGARK
ncbi:alpha-N-arabinofuranosidase [Verrucomicrobium sp. GAS474]|nr:alpha-N-arabinofuranosidase [Verrucomicrobium sp. GAS474]